MTYTQKELVANSWDVWAIKTRKVGDKVWYHFVVSTKTLRTSKLRNHAARFSTVDEVDVVIKLLQSEHPDQEFKKIIL
jgi:hypothetical protein